MIKDMMHTETRSSLPARVWPFFWRTMRDGGFNFVFFFCAVMMVINTAGKLSLSYLVGDIVEIAQSHTAYDWDLFIGPLTFLSIMVSIIVASYFIDAEGWKRYSGPYQKYVTNLLFKRTLSKPYDYHINGYSGHVSQKISDIMLNTMLIGDGVLYHIIPILASLLIGLVLLAFSNIYLALGCLIWFCIFIFYALWTGSICGQYAKKVSRKRGLLSGQLNDSFLNIHNIKSFARESAERKHISKYVDRFERSSHDIFHFQRNMITGASMLNGLFLLAMAGLLIHQLMIGQVSLASISTQFVILFFIVRTSAELPFEIRILTNILGIVQDGLDVLEIEKPLPVEKGAGSLHVQKSSIAFDNICFHYDARNIVLDGFDLEIKHNEKIGLIGASGAGKSSLVNLLLRFYEPQSGAIKVDDQNIKDVSKESLMRNIALIPQDTTLFHRTLMDNIRYGRLNASDEEVIAAAKRAHAHEFIVSLPEGYDTFVGERGVKLSGGQRQRIAIARAILKDAPILVLDEATSALDSESEKLIQESFADLMDGKTVIAIAHRLSTIAHMDRLIVMDKGRIVEQGSHKELLAKKDGLYAKLWGMQSGGFLRD